MKRFALLSVAVLFLAACSTFSRDTPSVYMVFFPASNTVLSGDAREVVAHAADAVRMTKPEP